MSDIDRPKPAKPRFRLTAFRAGLIAGVLAPILAPFAFGALLKITYPELEPAAFNVEVRSSGADVSRHGGVRLVVEHAHGKAAQICNDGCDDFEFDARSGDNSYKVRVLNAAGECVACDAGMYVTDGYGSGILRWTVSGQDLLSIRVSSLDRNADGDFTERWAKVTPAPAPAARKDATAPAP